MSNSASQLEYGSGIIPESLTDTEYQELQLAENVNTIVEQEEEYAITVQEAENAIAVQEAENAIAEQEEEYAIAVQGEEYAIAVQGAAENAIAQQETEENRPETEMAAEQKRQEEEAATAAALKDEEQGQAEKAEQEAVYAKRGDYGDKVRRVQQDLITLHYILGTPDGEFGGVTESAVRAFQADNNYEVTGILTKAQSEDLGKQAQEEEIRRKA